MFDLGKLSALQPHDTDTRPTHAPDDVEDELTAALPETQGARFFPMLRGLAWRLLALGLLTAAGVMLWRAFHDLSPQEVAEAVRAWGWDSVALAVLFSATSFLLMGVLEWMGLRWAGARVPLPSALAGSFIASSLAHSLGANLLVSGAVRARFYAKHGITFRQVAATTLFHGFSFTIGLSTLAGLALVLAGSQDVAAASRIANPVADGLGAALLVAVGGYVVLCATLRRPLRGFGHSVRLPSVRTALAQMSIGAVDNAVAAAILWVLLPAGSVGYFTFVAAYAPSLVLGLVSHVPGGVGVFEGSLTALLKGLEPAGLAAALLGYRLVFFVLPLLLGTCALAIDTLRQRAAKKI